MSTVAVAVVRDEADIITRTIDQIASQVDHVIVADNGSTDGTREILADRGVQVIDDDCRAFLQAEKVTALAQIAGSTGATWVVPFDADEMWFAPPGTTIAEVLKDTPAEVNAVGAVFFNHVATDTDDMAEPDPVKRLQWRELHNGDLMRVAARVTPDLTIEDGNHFVFHGDRLSFAWPRFVVRHYSLRSFDQFSAKARKCVEGIRRAGLHPAIAAHWREWADAVDSANPDEALRAIWDERLHRDPEGDFALTCDPAEVR